MIRVSRCVVLASLLFIGGSGWGQSTTSPPASNQGPSGTNQADSKSSYEERKKFAASLFNKQFNLEALPIFEELASQNPGDSEVLLGLGSCLLSHSATLKDNAAAQSERIRAREILLRGKQLGNNSGLLMNLLDNLPADGSVHYSGSPHVAEAIAAGEAAFVKNDYQEAIKNYSKAFELDPKNYGAALFIGDCYFALKNVPKAAEWYERAIQINPDTETGYRYEADMYTKNGDQQKARKLAIQGVVADPYVQISWRGLAQWATANKLKLTPVRINTHSQVSEDNIKNTTTIDPNGNRNSMGVWIVYSGVRVKWQKEEFKKHYPQETAYRHTMTEEVDALSTAAGMLKDEKLDALLNDADLANLKKLFDASMLEPYVLLSAPDAGIAVDYVAYRSKNRAKLEEYLSTYVVPQAPIEAGTK